MMILNFLIALDIGMGANLAVGNVFSRSVYINTSCAHGPDYLTSIKIGYNKTNFLIWGTSPFIPLYPAPQIISSIQGPFGVMALEHKISWWGFFVNAGGFYFSGDSLPKGSFALIPSMGFSFRSSRDTDGSFVQLEIIGSWGLTELNGIRYKAVEISFSVFPLAISRNSGQEESQR